MTLPAQPSAALPPRIEHLRLELIKVIPRRPNNRASLLHIQQKRITDMVIAYLNWRSRFLGVRPRSVNIEPAALADPRWPAMSVQIEIFLEKVRRGDDLTAHLSIKPHTQGYAPAARAPGAPPEDRWSDKDFTLNTTGYHHFHLGATIEAAGHAARTDDLIFARVSRDQFTVVAIFDHSVFDSNSAERYRLWAVHQNILLRGAPAGSIVMMGNITTSGHSLHVVRYAQDCCRMMRDLDPKLDDPEFVRSLYSPREEAPAKPKPSWKFVHLDLAIYDKAKPGYLVVQKGWN